MTVKVALRRREQLNKNDLLEKLDDPHLQRRGAFPRHDRHLCLFQLVEQFSEKFDKVKNITKACVIELVT